jgi:hypothetical protein
MYFSNEINNHLENKKPHDTKANTCHNWSWYGNLIWYRSSSRDIGFTHIVAHPKVFALTIAMAITIPKMKRMVPNTITDNGLP